MQVVLKKKKVSIFKHLAHSWIFTHHEKNWIKCMFLGKVQHLEEMQ